MLSAKYYFIPNIAVYLVVPIKFFSLLRNSLKSKLKEQTVTGLKITIFQFCALFTSFATTECFYTVFTGMHMTGIIFKMYILISSEIVFRITCSASLDDKQDRRQSYQRVVNQRVSFHRYKAPHMRARTLPGTPNKRGQVRRKTML